MTGHEYTAKPEDEAAPEETKEEKKKKRRAKVKRFFTDLFTKRLGIKALAIVLAFVMVILINI